MRKKTELWPSPIRVTTPVNPPVRVPAQWDWHYHQLQLLRECLFIERDHQIAEVTGPFERGGNFNDNAADELDHDLALALFAEEQQAVDEMEAAIERILSGTYGICEATEQPIPAERLRAVPWTRYTVRMQERLEQQRFATRQPRAALWNNGLA